MYYLTIEKPIIPIINKQNKKVYKLLFFILAFILIAVISVLIIKNYQQQTINNQTSDFDFVKGEIIVSFKENISKEDIISIFKKYDLKSEDKEELSSLQDIGMYKVYVPNGKEKYYIEKLKQEPIVETASLNHILQPN